MPPPEKVTMEAELRVEWPSGSDVVRTFDRAWHLALEAEKPCKTTLLRFVRKD